MTVSWKLPGELATVLMVAVAAGCASHAPAAAPPGGDTPVAAPIPSPPTAPTASMEIPKPSLSPAPPTASRPIGQEALDAAASRVEPLLKGVYGDWYAGLELQQPHHPSEKVVPALIIHRIPHPALDDAVRSAIPGVPVIFADAEYNAKQVDAFRKTIDADVPYWNSRGIAISLMSPGVDGRFTIGVLDAGKARAAMDARYGADRIDVIQTPFMTQQ